MSRRRCIACHIQEPGMIAIYQHPRGVDRIWTYVTGIIVKSRDQLCIPCYDELRVAHRFKEKCIHNNINRLGLPPRRQPATHVQHEPPTSDDSVSAEPPATVLPLPPPLQPSPQAPQPSLAYEARTANEECLLVQPHATNGELPAGARLDFFIKTEPTEEEHEEEDEIHQPCDADQKAQEEHNVSLPTLTDDGREHIQSEQHEVPSLEVVKMELELSLNDIGLKDGTCDDSSADDVDDGNEEPGERLRNAFSGSLPEGDGLQQACGQCEQTFLSRASLKQHQQKEHKRARRDITNAIKHRRILSGKINALMCRYCYREFVEPDVKASHEETHLNDPKPFQCSYADCNRLFQHRSALNRHFYTHVTPKRFKCSVCPKRFHQHSSMVVHERQHRGDRPYICPQCGKGFTHVSNVKRHIRFHNGEKPYQCGKCPARFTTSTDLRRHMNSRRCMIGSIKAAI